MPRTARVLVDGGTYHLVGRSNNGQRLFQDDRDYQHYLQLLSDRLRAHHVTLFHFALLPTHVHLLVEISSAKGLSKAMHSLNLAYGHFYRRRYRYSGHLWRERFKSCAIDPQQSLLACGRYIELNPVRAGLVNSPDSYPWSSYRAYAEGAEHPFICRHPAYESLGATPEERQRYYREFLLQGLQPLPRQTASSGLFFRPLPRPPKPLDDLFGPARAKRGRPRRLPEAEAASNSTDTL